MWLLVKGEGLFIQSWEEELLVLTFYFVFDSPKPSNKRKSDFLSCHVCSLHKINMQFEKNNLEIQSKLSVQIAPTGVPF